ncbi:MAG TPA: hypothetical protein VFW11_03700 [Cyclobacteriaceae bacterium]|nr:hypothetical protein [Cyclobacteriaceae bacterium]
MNKIVTYLESKEVVFHGAIALIILYIPHAGHLFMQLEHLDLTLFGFSILNWIYCIALAAVIEFLILVFIVNGYKTTGKFYAVVSFFINAFYFDYWFVVLEKPSSMNIKLTVISLVICLIHTLSIWQLSELFSKRLKSEKEKVVEHWCHECEAGPFHNKRSLDGHISKVHRVREKEFRKIEVPKDRLNDLELQKLG